MTRSLRGSARRALTAAATARWKAQHQPSGARRALKALPDGARFHLGCGDDRLDGRVNVDVRATPATDVVADLNRPAIRSASSVESHAFFEHVYRDRRVPHLRAVREALTAEGWVLYLGIPDFREIARLYLEGAPGSVSDTFDLFEVYRYTHGDPEHAPDWWLAQLHKSLFDRSEIESLLRAAGFGSWVIANYAFRDEPHALNLAFYARRDAKATREAAADALRDWADKVNLATVRWE